MVDDYVVAVCAVRTGFDNSAGIDRHNGRAVWRGDVDALVKLRQPGYGVRAIAEPG